MRCAERMQACRCESKGSHYYCQKEPSSLLKVWRVLLLQSTHKSTQLQNLRENALNNFCRLFESAFTLVLIPPHVHAFRGANHLLRQILRQLGLYEADGCVPIEYNKDKSENPVIARDWRFVLILFPLKYGPRMGLRKGVKNQGCT